MSEEPSPEEKAYGELFDSLFPNGAIEKGKAAYKEDISFYYIGLTEALKQYGVNFSGNTSEDRETFSMGSSIDPTSFMIFFFYPKIFRPRLERQAEAGFEGEVDSPFDLKRKWLRLGFDPDELMGDYARFPLYQLVALEYSEQDEFYSPGKTPEEVTRDVMRAIIDNIAPQESKIFNYQSCLVHETLNRQKLSIETDEGPAFRASHELAYRKAASRFIIQRDQRDDLSAVIERHVRKIYDAKTKPHSHNFKPVDIRKPPTGQYKILNDMDELRKMREQNDEAPEVEDTALYLEGQELMDHAWEGFKEIVPITDQQSIRWGLMGSAPFYFTMVLKYAERDEHYIDSRGPADTAKKIAKDIFYSDEIDSVFPRLLAEETLRRQGLPARGKNLHFYIRAAQGLCISGEVGKVLRNIDDAVEHMYNERAGKGTLSAGEQSEEEEKDEAPPEALKELDKIIDGSGSRKYKKTRRDYSPELAEAIGLAPRSDAENPCETAPDPVSDPEPADATEQTEYSAPPGAIAELSAALGESDSSSSTSQSPRQNEIVWDLSGAPDRSEPARQESEEPFEFDLSELSGELSGEDVLVGIRFDDSGQPIYDDEGSEDDDEPITFTVDGRTYLPDSKDDDTKSYIRFRPGHVSSIENPALKKAPEPDKYVDQPERDLLAVDFDDLDDPKKTPRLFDGLDDSIINKLNAHSDSSDPDGEQDLAEILTHGKSYDPISMESVSEARRALAEANRYAEEARASDPRNYRNDPDADTPDLGTRIPTKKQRLEQIQSERSEQISEPISTEPVEQTDVEPVDQTHAEPAEQVFEEPDRSPESPQPISIIDPTPQQLPNGYVIKSGGGNVNITIIKNKGNNNIINTWPYNRKKS